MRWVWFVCALLLALGGCEREARSPAAEKAGRTGSEQKVPPADLVLKNGYIYTTDKGRGAPRALAVRDGRLVYLGADAGAEPFIGPHTRVENLAGGLVLPAFIDAHMQARSDDTSVNLHTGRSVQHYQRALRQFIRDNPERQVIVGRGWDETVFDGVGPHKDQLDQVNDLIPIVLFSSDMRSLWVNSEALAAAGINGDTANPPGGLIARDENNMPTGVLSEAAMALVEKIIPPDTGSDSREQQDQQREAKAIIARWGISTLEDVRTKIADAFARRREGDDKLATGELADFIVLNKNLFAIPAEEIGHVKLLRTYSAGRLVTGEKNE